MSLIVHDELERYRTELMADAIDAVSDQMAFGIFGALMGMAKDAPELGAEIIVKASRAYLEAVAHVHGHDEALVRGDQLACGIEDSVGDIANEDDQLQIISPEAIEAILIAYEEYKR